MSSAGCDAALRTQLHVDTSTVFSSYSHRGEAAADVTFNLKDLRVMLALCEAMNANIALRFEQPGAPLLAEPYATGPHVSDTSEPSSICAVRVGNQET